MNQLLTHWASVDIDKIILNDILVSGANTGTSLRINCLKSSYTFSEGVIMDTKFSVAIHILVMITESEKSLTSQALAISVGTNASYIRKVIGLLKKSELICSYQGKSGYKLTKAPNQISLFDIYYATQEIDRVNLFQIHQNPNESCPVGKYIENTLKPIFLEVEIHLAKEMSNQTLEDVIATLYQQAKIAR